VFVVCDSTLSSSSKETFIVFHSVEVLQVRCSLRVFRLFSLYASLLRTWSWMTSEFEKTLSIDLWSIGRLNLIVNASSSQSFVILVSYRHTLWAVYTVCRDGRNPCEGAPLVLTLYYYQQVMCPMSLRLLRIHSESTSFMIDCSISRSSSKQPINPSSYWINRWFIDQVRPLWVQVVLHGYGLWLTVHHHPIIGLQSLVYAYGLVSG